jgi:uncharacterized protein (UPF0210 family)
LAVINFELAIRILVVIGKSTRKLVKTGKIFGNTPIISVATIPIVAKKITAG